MPDAISSYRIYLLTVWRAPQGLARDGEPDQNLPTDTGWRFFLEDPRTGRRCGFSNPIDLVAVLITEFGYGAPAPDEPSPSTGETGPQ